MERRSSPRLASISRRKAILIVAFVGVLLAGFAAGSLTQERVLFKAPSPIPTPMPAPEVVSEIVSKVEYVDTEFVGRMMIYRANLEVEVTDIESAVERVGYIADEFGGFVAEVSVSGRESKVGRITLRVPEANFHDAVARIEELGDVVEKRVESEDVTERYIDLKARLETREKQEKRLLEILEGAKTVEEVLTVEKELWRIREEIERLTGQMLYLERMVRLATITVLLDEKAPRPWVEIPGVDWSAPIEMGLWAMATIVQGLIIFVTALIPFAVIGVPIYYVYRRRKGRGERVQQTS